MRTTTRFLLAVLTTVVSIPLFSANVHAAPTLEETLKIMEERNYRFEHEVLMRTYEELEQNGQKIVTDLLLAMMLKGHQHNGIMKGELEYAVEITHGIEDKSFKTNMSQVLEVITQDKLNFIKVLGYSFNSELGMSIFAPNIENYFSELYQSEEFYRVIQSPSAQSELTQYVMDNILEIHEKMQSLELLETTTTFLENGHEQITVRLSPQINIRNSQAAKEFFSLLLSKVPESDTALQIKQYIATLSDEEFASNYEEVMSELEKPLFEGIFTFENDRPTNLVISFSPYQLGFSLDTIHKINISYRSTPKIILPDAESVIIEDDLYAPIGNKDIKILSLENIQNDDYEMLAQKHFIEITQSCQTKSCAMRELRKLQRQLSRKYFQSLRKDLESFYKKGFGLPLA